MIYYYIKSFLRSIQKNFFFHSINLTGFFAGIFLFTLIFTFIFQEFSFDGFHKNRSAIYRIQSGGYGVTPLCFGEKLRNKMPEIKTIVRFSSKELVVKLNQKEITIGNVSFVDPEIFQVFSFRLLSGNPSTALNTPFSIVISRSVSRRLFGAGQAMGEMVHDKDGSEYTITGIMEDIPYNSHIRTNAFISIETLRRTQGEEAFNCGAWCNSTYLQLQEHVGLPETERKLNALLEDSRMETSDGKMVLKIEPLGKIYFDYENNKFDGSMHGNLQTVILYLAISILILFIVIINYINLSIAISGTRLKSISIQKINGASPGQIIWQSVLESCGIAFLSFLISLLAIELLLPQISQLFNLPVSPSMNRLPVYGYLLAGILFTGTVAGILPGLYISRINLVKSLKNETVFHSRGLQRKVFLVIQMAIVAIMLNCTFIINRQIAYIFKKDMGFRHENIVSFYMDEPLQARHDLLKQTLLANPEIQGISFSDGLIGDGLTKRPVRIDSVEKLCNFLSVDPDYLDLYSIKLKYGRNFSCDLATDRERSYLMNEAACRAFGIENPTGLMIHEKRIVGVVRDFNFSTLHNQIEPLIMSCEEGRAVQLKIGKEDHQAVTDFIYKACRNISPESDCTISFLDDRIEKLYKSELDLRSSFRVYSFITFFISMLGLFGLTLFQSGKMTKEISIRKMHGAGLPDTFRRFTKDYVQIIMISNGLSVPVSLWVMQKWLVHFEYKAEIDPLVFFATLVITAFFSLLAVSFFVIRTHRADPLETLKHE